MGTAIGIFVAGVVAGMLCIPVARVIADTISQKKDEDMPRLDAMRELLGVKKEDGHGEEQARVGEGVPPEVQGRTAEAGA